MFSAKTLIKHYTPPTCTLEIYSNDFLFLFNKYNQIPKNFNFELQFDDPRFPDEKRGIIKGDRQKLELLGEVVNNYVNQFLQGEKPSFPHCALGKDNNSNDIYMMNQGLLNQELYYFSRDKNNWETIINLTTLQLFDLANTLEQYKLDVKKFQEKGNNPQKQLTLFSLFVILLSIIGGGIWWQNRFILSKDNQQLITIDSEKLKTKIQEVIPPNSLNPSTIPSVYPLQLPPELKNRQKLPPPPAIPNTLPNQLVSSNSVSKKAKNTEKIVIPTPPAVPNQPSSQLKPNSSNVITINPQPQSLTSNKINPSQSLSNNSPRTVSVTKVPVLQESSDLFAPPNSNLNGGLNNSVSVLPDNINKIPPSLKVNSSEEIPEKSNSMSSKNTNIQSEVKQYFKKKWQPPENLTQSIEYRLIINNDGSLKRVTPMGLASVTFLDRTGMPLMGEVITSSFPADQQATVRLILSPNGNVETFLE